MICRIAVPESRHFAPAPEHPPPDIRIRTLAPAKLVDDTPPHTLVRERCLRTTSQKRPLVDRDPFLRPLKTGSLLTCMADFPDKVTEGHEMRGSMPAFLQLLMRGLRAAL